MSGNALVQAQPDAISWDPNRLDVVLSMLKKILLTHYCLDSCFHPYTEAFNVPILPKAIEFYLPTIQ